MEMILDDGKFEAIELEKDTVLILGTSPTTYKFLQNLNLYKMHLLQNGCTFKLLLRVDEQHAIIKVIPR